MRALEPRLDGDQSRREHAIERELAEARAEALLRIAGTLEVLLEELTALERQLASAAPNERPRLAAAYNATREEAGRWRWYLEVQREAVGLRGHAILDEVYPLPRRALDIEDR